MPGQKIMPDLTLPPKPPAIICTITPPPEGMDALELTEAIGGVRRLRLLQHRPPIRVMVEDGDIVLVEGEA